MNPLDQRQIESRLRRCGVEDTQSPIPTAADIQTRIRRGRRSRWMFTTATLGLVAVLGVWAIAVSEQEPNGNRVVEIVPRLPPQQVHPSRQPNAEIASQRSASPVDESIYFVVGSALPSGWHPVMIVDEHQEAHLAGYIEPARVQRTPVWNLHPSLITRIDREWSAAGYSLQPIQ